jgi:hypothetical protein
MDDKGQKMVDVPDGNSLTDILDFGGGEFMHVNLGIPVHGIP